MPIEKYPSELPLIKTNNLLLRKLTLADADDVYAYARIPQVTKYVIWEPHQSKTESENFIQLLHELFEKKEQLIWGIEFEPDKKIVGTIGFNSLSYQHSCAEIGYAISDKYWNKGIATEALKAILKYGFDELELNRQEAHCKEENIASEKVMLRAGMSYEGTLREKIFMKGEFWTMKMFSILRKEYYDKN